MAVAAGVAAAAATAIATGVSVASQAGAFGGAPGAPKIQQVPKRPFETAQQKYMSRVMMANLNNRGPTWNDWLNSGGTAEFQLKDPGMTPGEAVGLGLVGSGGQEVPWFDPSQKELTIEQQAFMGQQRKRRKALDPHGATFATTPEERMASLYDRKQRLEARGANPKALERVNTKLQRVKEHPEAYTRRPVQKEDDGGIMSIMNPSSDKPPWERF